MKISATKPALRCQPPTHRHLRALTRAGYPTVAGIDEVGRGCWAGPVVAAAVILPPTPALAKHLTLAGVTDSKLLSHPRRVTLARLIKRHALGVGLGWVAAAELDDHGLTWAVQQSGLRALADLTTPYDAVLLDGNYNYLRDHCYAQAIVRGDQLSLSIAAASIIAKVARDQFMVRLSCSLPDYGFAQHKGYGTTVHRQALKTLGPSPYHRRSWTPLVAFGSSASDATEASHA